MNLATTHINIRTDAELKIEAQQVFADLGLDMSTAINLFLRQVVNKQAIPFELAKRKVKTPQLGCLKGRITEADGHDWFEPMDDFKDYM